VPGRWFGSLEGGRILA